LLTAILLGFVLGIRHAADPDHVAAIATLVARHRSPKAAAGIGAAWGIGHGLTILAVGGALVALRIEWLPGWTLVAEIAVAVILVGLGAANLRTVWRGLHGVEGGHARVACRTRLRSAAIGMAHGLAGSAAVALLALAAMPDSRTALIYLLVFGLGTVAGMVAASLGMGIPAARAASSPRAARWALAGSGALSIGVGLYLAIEVGVATHWL
jgi:high-affinity nickel-transport protein